MAGRPRIEQFESQQKCQLIINLKLMHKKAKKGVGQNKNFGRYHFGGAEEPSLEPKKARLPA